MFESINAINTEEIIFARKTGVFSIDYEEDISTPEYEKIKINSNVHETSNENEEHDNPQYKTKKTIRLTNNSDSKYLQGDYFSYDGVIYIVKVAVNRITFNYCIAENIDEVKIIELISALLDSDDVTIEGSDEEPLLG